MPVIFELLCLLHCQQKITISKFVHHTQNFYYFISFISESAQIAARFSVNPYFATIEIQRKGKRKVSISALCGVGSKRLRRSPKVKSPQEGTPTIGGYNICSTKKQWTLPNRESFWISRFHNAKVRQWGLCRLNGPPARCDTHFQGFLLCF